MQDDSVPRRVEDKQRIRAIRAQFDEQVSRGQLTTVEEQAQFWIDNNIWNKKMERIQAIIELTKEEEQALIELVCPIGQDYMQMPCIAPDNQRYDYYWLISAYYSGLNTCPLVPSIELSNPETWIQDNELSEKRDKIFDRLARRANIKPQLELSRNSATLFAAPAAVAVQACSIDNANSETASIALQKV